MNIHPHKGSGKAAELNELASGSVALGHTQSEYFQIHEAWRTEHKEKPYAAVALPCRTELVTS
jgi:hypothetical protein